MPADPIPLRRFTACQSTGSAMAEAQTVNFPARGSLSPSAEAAADVAWAHIELLRQHAADMAILNRDAAQCRTPEDVEAIKARTLQIVRAALEAVSTLSAYMTQACADAVAAITTPPSR